MTGARAKSVRAAWRLQGNVKCDRCCCCTLSATAFTFLFDQNVGDQITAEVCVLTCVEEEDELVHEAVVHGGHGHLQREHQEPHEPEPGTTVSYLGPNPRSSWQELVVRILISSLTISEAGTWGSHPA